MENRMVERKDKRFKFTEKISANFILSTEVIIKDISAGGICMETKQRLITNRQYRIQLVSRNNEKQWLKCVVMWSLLKRTILEHNNAIPIYEVGLKFDELNKNQKSFVDEIISEFADGPINP
jgi:hypothetical protein